MLQRSRRRKSAVPRNWHAPCNRCGAGGLDETDERTWCKQCGGDRLRDAAAAGDELGRLWKRADRAGV